MPVRLRVTGLTGIYWGNLHSLGGAPSLALKPSLEIKFSVAQGKPVDWTEELVGAWTSLAEFSLCPPTPVKRVITKASR